MFEAQLFHSKSVEKDVDVFDNNNHFDHSLTLTLFLILLQSKWFCEKNSMKSTEVRFFSESHLYKILCSEVGVNVLLLNCK